MADPKRKPVIFKEDPEMIAQMDRVAKQIPAFEGNRSVLIRVAIREFIQRHEAEMKERAA